MLLQPAGDLHELLVGFRHLLGEILNRLGIPDACDHILPLGVDEIFAHHLLIAGGGVAGERHAGPGVIAHIAENHGHDINSRAQVIRDALFLTVRDGALAHPGFEDGLGCQLELLVHILWKIEPDVLFECFLERGNKRLPVFGGHLRVELIPLILLVLCHRMLEDFVIQIENGRTEHFDQTAVRVPGKTRVSGQPGQAVNNFVVQTDVQDGIHHARHGELSA